MQSMDRRRFLALTAATATLPSLKLFAQATTTTATLTLLPGQPGVRVPKNFIGLSYETQQLSDPTFFSPKNTGLIAQFRALTPNGVLRLGGNTSDYGFWKPTPTSIAPPRAKREYKLGDPNPNLSYAIEPIAIHNLRAFLDATGWTCLYGINLGTNLPALAADEAVFVHKTLGPVSAGGRLEYFQIGNEADRFATTIRDPKTWSASVFLDEWLTFAHAILARVPTARFGLPDVASNAQWFSTIATGLAHNPIRSHIACISHHYYIGGPPSNPDMTISRILRPNPVVTRDAALVTAAATQLHTAWRMTEGNTCYRGGKPGVSDVFASALWSADYLLQLASLGYAGVNLHGGDGQMVANSLGGTLPGEALMPDPKLPHPRPVYTPIAHIGDQYLLEPVAYGMLFANHFAGATMIPLDFNPGPVNATAYAAKRPDGQLILAIINKDEHLPIDLEVVHHQDATFHYLKGSSLSSREVEFRTTTRRGEWNKLEVADAWLSIHLPPAQAGLYELGQYVENHGRA
jgi:hypothetical protein